MYISICRSTVDDLEAAKTRVERVHEFMREMPGFRWAMLLSDLEAPGKVAAVSMWLQPEQASTQDATALGAADAVTGFDVATARGSMTPATHAGIVDWTVGEENAGGFANRWNAAYHAIEDRIGSRLLRDLSNPAHYAGLHAVTTEANLTPNVVGATISDANGLSVTPEAVQQFRVILLTEA